MESPKNSALTRLNAWTTRPERRIRISTVFLILALINMPEELNWVTLPAWMWQEPWHDYTGFYFIDVTGMAIALCLFINLIALPLNMWKKRWQASHQAVFEIGLSLFLAIWLPAY